MAHHYHWMDRGLSSKLTGFISGLPSKCLVSMEYWKVLVGQQDTTASISPNLPGYMFLHAANTDSQYWLAGITEDATVERGHCLPSRETTLQSWIFNSGNFFLFLPLSLISEVQNNLRQSGSGMVFLFYCCGPNPWNVNTGEMLG